MSLDEPCLISVGTSWIFSEVNIGLEEATSATLVTDVKRRHHTICSLRQTLDAISQYGNMH